MADKQSFKLLVCETGLHCGRCREASEAGAKFRASMAGSMEMPEGWPDCWRGWKLGEKPEPPAPKPRTVAVPARRAASKPGPGDRLKSILVRLGYEELGGGQLRCANGKQLTNCGCEAMRRKMNDWGYAGCRKNWRELRTWFRDKAAKCGVQLGPITLGKVLLAAIAEFGG